MDNKKIIAAVIAIVVAIAGYFGYSVVVDPTSQPAETQTYDAPSQRVGEAPTE